MAPLPRRNRRFDRRSGRAVRPRAAVDRFVVAGWTLVGCAIRVPGIAWQPLQWDEGWSIAVARLPMADALRLTALDVHPPLYYGLLHAWIRAVGTTPLAVRSLSLLTAAAAIPLAAAAARAWLPASGAEGHARRWAGWTAATAAALAPPLVYYAGVGRMYALASVGVLAAAWGVAAWLDVDGSARTAGRRACGLAVAVGGSAGALLSFYYSGFALAGLAMAALIARPAAWRRWAAWVGATAVLAAPWLVFAAPQLAARMSARASSGGGTAGEAATASLAGLIGSAWRAVLFVNTGTPTLAVVAALSLAGALAVAPRRRQTTTATGLPIVLVCVAVAVGARAHMFAPRYASVATPFVALGIGWAAAGAVRRRWAAGLTLVALAAAAWPTISGAIFARSAEWFDAYDPGAIRRAVIEMARPGDVVVFNILSQAGAYDSAAAADVGDDIVDGGSIDRDRVDRNGVDGGILGSDPSWTYAQLWDPVHEPVKPAIRRVENAYEAALRGRDAGTAALWLALYKGTAATDTAALKAWADGEYFPTAGHWVSDTLLAGYIDAPTDATAKFEPAAEVGAGIELRQARFTSRAAPGGNVALILRWRAARAIERDARVVVRLVDAAGRTVAQRDAVPVAESRPTTSWAVGESLEDRHGLRLPMAAHGKLRIVVGLVDDASGVSESSWGVVDVGAVEIVEDRADAYRH